MPGTQVTYTDLATGDTEHGHIEDDYVVICDGNKYLAGVLLHPSAGTAVVTIKTRKDQA